MKKTGRKVLVFFNLHVQQRLIGYRNISGGGVKMDKQIRVLVVDDGPRISHLILKVLAQEGYTIDVSFSGADALR